MVLTGSEFDAGGLEHGYLRDHDGAIRLFEAPRAGTAAGQGTEAFSINTAGDVVGVYTDAKGVVHGFLRVP